MLVERLTLTNFMRYRDRCALDFAGKELVGIVGENESGKSTLLQAISYGIYGRTRADRELQLINDSGDGDLLVELALRMPDGSLLEITRGRTGRNEPICKVAGLGDCKATDATEHILDTVGLSYEDFISLVYFVQGDLHQFMQGNKRTYFQRWTSELRTWQKYEVAAGARLADVEEALGSVDFDIRKQTEVIERAGSIVGEVNASKIAYQTSKDAVALTRRKVATAQANYERIAATNAGAQQSVEVLRQKVAKYASALSKMRANIDRDRTESKRVRSGRCPILSVECEGLKEEGKKQQKKQQTRLARSEIEEKALVKNLALSKKRLAVALQTGQQTYLSALEEGARQVQDAQETLHDAHDALREATIRYDRALAARDRVDKAKKIRKARKWDRRGLERDARRLKFVRFMCGRAGVPAMLIDAELERVEERCNWVLDRLDYPKRIRFAGHRELATFEKVCPSCGSEQWSKGACKSCGEPRPRKRKEEPTVTILDGITERPFELESGGAQVLQSFAVRLAASLFVSSMSGVSLRMVLLDEVFGMLDATNRQKLMTLVIGKLRSEFGLKQQFVVSHQEDVVNAVDHLLLVRNERGSATASWQ